MNEKSVQEVSTVRSLETKHSNIEKAAQFARVVRVLKLAERLGLDLPDSFAGYRELLSDLF